MVERAEAHPQSPSARFAKYLQGIREHALRTATERAATDRKRQDDTEYHRATEPKGE